MNRNAVVTTWRAVCGSDTTKDESMKRSTAVTLWREICGSDAVMSMPPTGRMLEAFAAKVRDVCVVRVEAEHVGENVCDDCDNERSAAYNRALRDAAQSLRAWA